MRAYIYVHADKDSMRSKGEGLGLKGEALRRFIYAAVELKIELDIDPITGMTKIISVDDMTVTPHEPVGKKEE